MENRTDKLQTDLTDYTNFKIEKEVAIRDEKFVELDEEVRVFKDFNTSVTADLTKQREDHEEVKETTEVFAVNTGAHFDKSDYILHKLRELVHPEEFDMPVESAENISEDSGDEHLTDSARASPLDDKLQSLKKIPTLAKMCKKTNKQVYGCPTKPTRYQKAPVFYRKDALEFMVEQNGVNKAMIQARHELAQHVFGLMAKSDNVAAEQQAQMDQMKRELMKVFKTEIRGVIEQVDETNDGVVANKKGVDDLNERFGEFEEDVESFKETTMAA